MAGLARDEENGARPGLTMATWGGTSARGGPRKKSNRLCADASPAAIDPMTRQAASARDERAKAGPAARESREMVMIPPTRSPIGRRRRANGSTPAGVAPAL